MHVIRRQDTDTPTPQGLLGQYAISAETVGSQGLFMALYRIPPGGRSVAHYHTNCETAVYLLRGTVRAYTGDDLSQVYDVEPGQFVYLPANEVHMVENLSATEWCEYVLARNAPTEIVVEVPVTPPQRATLRT
ncbi:MAG: cupin domain-containing protein [Chloroflexi bacterium]|nr:cupin domain-containing protein [Chloroflexota bacterium]